MNAFTLSACTHPHTVEGARETLLSEVHVSAMYCALQASPIKYPRESKYPMFEVPDPKSHSGSVFPTRNLKYWVLGPLEDEPATHQFVGTSTLLVNFYTCTYMIDVCVYVYIHMYKGHIDTLQDLPHLLCQDHNRLTIPTPDNLREMRQATSLFRSVYRLFLSV